MDGVKVGKLVNQSAPNLPCLGEYTGCTLGASHVTQSPRHAPTLPHLTAIASGPEQSQANQGPGGPSWGEVTVDTCTTGRREERGGASERDT